MGLGQSDAEAMRIDLQRSQFQGIGRPVRPGALPGRDPPVRLHRAALPRRAAARGLAPPDRGTDHGRARAAEAADRCADPVPERAALDRLHQARRRAGRHHRHALAGDARRLFRRPQDPVPRARISQDCRSSWSRPRNSANGPKSPTRTRRKVFEQQPRPARHAREARSVADRVSERRGSARRARPHHIRNVVRRPRQGAQRSIWPTSTSA